jgi:hypothetical protein
MPSNNADISNIIKKLASSSKCQCKGGMRQCSCNESCACKQPGGSCKKIEKVAESPAWQRSEGKNPEGGLNAKGRASLKAQGHDIKRPQPEGGPRKDSFCARMKGMKAKLTSSETANDPESRINKSLRKWKCASASDKLAELLKQARCWKGYEPVPGKKPYSDDSCRPAGSGKKEKKKKEK